MRGTTVEPVTLQQRSWRMQMFSSVLSLRTSWMVSFVRRVAIGLIAYGVAVRGEAFLARDDVDPDAAAGEVVQCRGGLGEVRPGAEEARTERHEPVET